MKKLTRYENFEALKSSVKPINTPSKTINKHFAEFEELLKLMRSKMAVNKNLDRSNIPGEQQFSK